jgi:hypothetical protein
MWLLCVKYFFKNFAQTSKNIKIEKPHF